MKPSELWIVARTSALLSLAVMFAIVGLLGLFGRPAPAQVMVNPIEYEHRVTSIETQVAALAITLTSLSTQLNDLKNTKWLELIALSGLLGETGIRTFKTRKQRQKEQDE